MKNANLTANNSEALVIEGKNSITREDCYVTGNMSDTKGTSSSENVHNVMIYQSMGGDADVGTSVFSMTGGSLVGSSGDMFYITNTRCLLTLSGVNIVNNDADGALLRVVGNSASRGWGTAGSNGAQVEFAADGQTLAGDIIVDTISNLTMTMKNGSTFTGTINIVDNAEGGTARQRQRVCRDRERLHLEPDRQLHAYEPHQQRHHQLQRLYHHSGRRHGAEVSPLYPCCCIYSSMVRRKASP